MLVMLFFPSRGLSAPLSWEVEGLLGILAEVIDRETDALHEQGVQLRHVGSEDGLPPYLLERVRYAVGLTRENRRLIVNVAFNYGGRAAPSRICAATHLQHADCSFGAVVVEKPI